MKKKILNKNNRKSQQRFNKQKTPRNYNRGFGVYVYKTNRAKISPTQLFL